MNYPNPFDDYDAWVKQFDLFLPRPNERRSFAGEAPHSRREQVGSIPTSLYKKTKEKKCQKTNPYKTKG